MAEQNWEDDALSEIYRSVWPTMWAGHRIVAALALGETARPADLASFDRAHATLTTDGPAALAKAGIALSPEDSAMIKEQAQVLQDVRRKLVQTDGKTLTHDSAAALMNAVEAELHPAIQRAIDRFRRVFIGFNMTRQENYAAQARETAHELRLISKKIFFISINASVEAARAGDAGRGFQQISSDIRALSHSAEAATADLSSLVETGGRA